jgi:L-amino acid N-acyltransferase YncA
MPEPNRVVIRAATSADAEAICAIYNAAIAERGSTFKTEPRRAEDFDDRIGAERFPFLVAEADGKVIGWAGLSSYAPVPATPGSERQASTSRPKHAAAASGRRWPRRLRPSRGQRRLDGEWARF